jgi:dTDP-4-amino-4,6-dideoxygalactose transaminase
MVLTNSAELYQRLLLLRSHGITRDPAAMDREPDGAWYYQQVGLGFNYRMTDLQAALGASQMTRLDQFVQRRHALADRYDRLLAGLALSVPRRDPDAWSAFHLYVVRLRLDGKALGQRQVFDALRARGIGVNLHYIPVHTQPHYRKMGFGDGDFPEAEAYYREAISLPLFYGLSEAEQDQVVDALREVLA